MSAERYRNGQQQGIEKKTRQRGAKHAGKVPEYRARTEPENEKFLQDEEAARRQSERWQVVAVKERELRREAAWKKRELENAKYQKREAKKISGHEGRMRGERSERRVHHYLNDQEKFPWIFEVQKAKQFQPGYDYTLKINTSHPLFRYIKVDTIYIDAKSSLEGVDDYFHEQAKRCHGERNKIFCNLNRFALSAGTEATETEMDLQMVLQVLLLCGALFDEKKTIKILELLDERLVTAYRTEERLVNQYVYAYIRAQLLPENTL